MTRKQHKGVWIRRSHGGRADMPVLTPLLCGASLFSLGTLTAHPAPWLPAAVGGLVCAAGLLVGKKGWFYPMALSVMVLAVVLFREDVMDGFGQMYNRMGDAYTAGTGIVLPALQTQGEGHALFSILSGAAAGLIFSVLPGSSVLAGLTALVCAGASILFRREIALFPLALCAAELCVPRRGRGALMPLGLLGALVLISQIPGVQTWAERQSALLQTQIHAIRYETGDTILPEGDISNAELPETDAAILIVTMDKPEELYLRGFTGAVLEGEQWEPLDTEILAGQEELLYWLNLNEFDLRAQFEAATAALETETNTVTVQNIGACSSFRYIPFGIHADGALRPEDLSDRAAGAGERYDVFTTVCDAPSLIPQLLETLAQSEDPQVRRYLQAESAYREFVRDNYLTVPEDTQLETYWKTAEDMEPQEAVRAVLARCYPDGAQRGPHYATAAVLTLRHFGIPARYAEGCIVPKTGETSVEATGSHAACWAEVYHDGIGWLPMAVTPGLEQTVQEETTEQSEPPETIPQQTQPRSEPDPSGGTQVRMEKVLLNGLITVLLLVLLVLPVLILRRRWILNRRRALLEQGDVRNAAAFCMADAVSMLARLGVHRGSGSLDAMAAPIRERFGVDYALLFQTAAGLNAKALFSSRGMDETERKTMLDFRDQTLELLKAEAGWMKKRWMQLILCLY